MPCIVILTEEPNPVSNATVYSTLSLSEALTDINGLFRIALSYFETILFNPSFCGFGFTLPAGTCGIAAPDTVLSTPIKSGRPHRQQ